jgi:hypothetical protein
VVNNLIANSSIHIWTSIYVTIVAVNRDIVNVRGKLSPDHKRGAYHDKITEITFAQPVISLGQYAPYLNV